MSLMPRPHGCPKCDCGCMCHKMMNVRHIMPCCGHGGLEFGLEDHLQKILPVANLKLAGMQHYKDPKNSMAVVDCLRCGERFIHNCKQAWIQCPKCWARDDLRMMRDRITDPDVWQQFHDIDGAE